MSEPVAWYVRHSANEPPMLFADEERAKKAAFSCGCGARPLYLSQVSPQENLTPSGDDFRIPPSSDPVHRMCDKALTQLGQQWMNKIDAAWGLKTPYDATPMAGSGPTVPAKDRASDCSEDGRVRASASSIGNTQEPVAWAVMVDGRRMYVSWSKEMCEDEAYYHRHPLGDSVSVVPLYRHRQPTLTDAEREALEWFTHGDSPFPEEASRMATVRGLLERLATAQVVAQTATSCGLTDAEREALTDAADRYAGVTPESAETAATLRGLLERLGGGR